MTWSVDRILEEVKILENYTKEVKHEIFKLSWYMRGGLSFEEAWNLSIEDRNILRDIIKENYEITKESKLPHF